MEKEWVVKDWKVTSICKVFVCQNSIRLGLLGTAVPFVVYWFLKNIWLVTVEYKMLN